MASHRSGRGSALVAGDAVHRDVYADQAIFELERARVFGRAWLYLAHESQCSRPGGYFATTLVDQPVVLVRGADGALRAFFNRCPHKGSRLVENGAGDIRQFRCPYHAWSFDLSGKRLSVPIRDGYEGTRLDACDWASHLTPLMGLHVYRGFVFASLDPVQPFDSYFGGVLHVLDDMVDRSPVDRLSIVGRPYRIRFRSNWKFYIENLQDTVHPHATHESAMEAALATVEAKYRGSKIPFRVMLSANLNQPFAFWEQLEQIAYPNGHTTMGGIVGVNFDEHPDSLLRDALVAAKGEAETKRILSVGRHNTIFYPNLAVQSTHHQLRVLHPVSAGETILEVHHLRIEGAPEEYYRERTLAYTNTVNAPTTPISADDIEMYRRVQAGLQARRPEWLSLHRDAGREAHHADRMTAVGTSELPQRAQLKAWAKLMDAAP